jgi:hypothetical protein
MEATLRKLVIAAAAATLVCAYGVPAQAAMKQDAQLRAKCEAQAKEKFSAIHFLKRRDFVNRCTGQAKAAKKQPADKSTTGAKPKS